MSRRRLRKLAGINESIADTPETNRQIVGVLDQLSAELRTPVLDALECLKDAGSSGLTLVAWAAQIRSMHGEDMPMGEVLKTAARQFPFVVKKVAPKTYAWEDQSDIAAAQLGSQVDLTSKAFALMRSMQNFTERDLAQRLSAAGHLPPEHVAAFVDHLIQNFTGMLIKTGNTYALKAEKPVTNADTMQSFRDIVQGPPKPSRQ
jgi:hypothetical protein